MFVGHFAAAFAAKRAAPELSLGTLFLAALLADLLCATLVLLGVEHFEVRPGITAVTPLDFVHYPWSHSLAAMAAWAVALALAWLAVRRGTPLAALVVVALVLSHWLLDWIAHRPDMPLTLGGAGRRRRAPPPWCGRGRRSGCWWPGDTGWTGTAGNERPRSGAGPGVCPFGPAPSWAHASLAGMTASRLPRPGIPTGGRESLRFRRCFGGRCRLESNVPPACRRQLDPDQENTPATKRSAPEEQTAEFRTMR